MVEGEGRGYINSAGSVAGIVSARTDGKAIAAAVVFIFEWKK